jgi:hypothetical protein
VVRAPITDTRLWRVDRIQGGPSAAKHHAAQIVPEPRDVFRIRCRSISFGELKELFLLTLLGLNPFLNELDDDSVGTEAPLPGEAVHLPDDFGRSRHGTILHNNGDMRST